MSTRRRHTKKPTEFTPIMRLWLLRLLVPIGAQRQFVSQMGFNDDVTAELLGLQEWVGTNPREFDQKLVRAALRKLHESVEVELHGASGLRPLLRTKFTRACAGNCTADGESIRHLWVVYPGTLRYSLAENITALPLGDMPDIRFGGNWRWRYN